MAQVALAAFCEGVAGASQKRFSWATVKLYYCAFQVLRARLLLGNQIVFYRGRTPHSIRTSAGQTARRRKGNTHSAVFTIFGEMFPANDLFNQDIDGEKPLRWLESRRNECSYGLAPIPDPEVPAEYGLFVKNPRAALQQFMKVDSLAFDSDSAIIALPMKLLMELSALVSMSFGNRIVRVDKHFLDILAAQRLVVPGFYDGLGCFDFAGYQSEG